MAKQNSKESYIKYFDKNTLYSEPDNKNIRHKIADVYTIGLSHAIADKIGAYHGDGENGVYGTLEYCEYTDGKKQIKIGMATAYEATIGGAYICSYAPLDKSDKFTKNQVNHMCHIVEDAMQQNVNKNFQLDESVLGDIKFAEPTPNKISKSTRELPELDETDTELSQSTPSY